MASLVYLGLRDCCLRMEPVSLKDGEPFLPESICVPSLKQLYFKLRKQLLFLNRLTIPSLVTFGIDHVDLYEVNVAAFISCLIQSSPSIKHLILRDLDSFDPCDLNVEDILEGVDARSFEIDSAPGQWARDLLRLSPNVSCVGHFPSCPTLAFQLCLRTARDRTIGHSTNKQHVPLGLWSTILSQAANAFETPVRTELPRYTYVDYRDRDYRDEEDDTPEIMRVSQADAIYHLLQLGKVDIFG